MNVQETSGMVVNESMKADLLTSAKWAKFLCIVGCIGIVLMIAVGIIVIAFSNKFTSIPGMTGIQSVMGVTYLITAILMIYPIVKGFQFANGTKAACLTGNEAELARGFAGMRSYLQFIGVLTIIVLIIYGLMLIGGAAVAAIFASQA